MGGISPVVCGIIPQFFLSPPCLARCLRWWRHEIELLAMNFFTVLSLLFVLLLSGCSAPWNDPYPAADAGKNVLYTAFTGRPKHLDPARAYSADESVFVAQIYQSPLQYHYLRRPYTLVPDAAISVPQPIYYAADGRRLPDNAPTNTVAYSVYQIHLRHGIFYQPHPAFARNREGKLLYRHLTAATLASIHTLADFRRTGTRELVAADYVYEIKRLADPRLQSPIFGLMSSYIVGLKALHRALQQTLAKRPVAERDRYLNLNRYPLVGAQVVSRYSYRIKIRGKYPQFRYWLAMTFFAPVPWEAVAFYAQPGMAARNLSLDWYPVGTGPYMLTVNDPNREMVLTRNPNFHGETYPREGAPGDRDAGLLVDAGKPLPFIEKIVFTLEKESIPYWNKFLQGYYDASSIASDSFDQAVKISTSGSAVVSPAMKARGIRLVASVAPSDYYLGVNMLDPLIGGYSARARKLRQAISIALDFEEYITIFANGRGVTLQGPIPPGIFGYRSGKAGIDPYVYNWVDGRPQRKSIKYARQLLAEAGYPDGRDANTGRPLLLYLDTTSAGIGSKSSLDWMRKQFAKLNIQLIVRSTDWNRFQDKIRRGAAQLFYYGWNADYPDPENFLFLLYGPNSRVKDNGENSSNYNDPEYNRLFVQMKDMADGHARQVIINRMVEIVQRDAPWLGGFHPKDFALYHSWVHNVKPNPMAQNDLKYQRIDVARRERLRRQWNAPRWWPLLWAALFLMVALLPAVITYWRREHAAPQLKGRDK